VAGCGEEGGAEMESHSLLKRRHLILGAPFIGAACSPSRDDPNQPNAIKSIGPNDQYVVDFVGSVEPDSCAALKSGMRNLVAAGATNIHFVISSAGGNVIPAVDLYDFLSSLDANITTYNSSAVESAGVIIYLAGKTRIAAQNSFFQLHGPWLDRTENNSKWRGAFLNTVEHQMENIYQTKMQLSHNQLSDLRERNSLILSSDEALNVGLVTHVVPHVLLPTRASWFSVHNDD
jgi:ATP-dependent protease ClpP protease subunit